MMLFEARPWLDLHIESVQSQHSLKVIQVKKTYRIPGVQMCLFHSWREK